MSYSIFLAIFLATIALSSASLPVFRDEWNVLVRFYSNYAQVYRPATMKSYVDEERTMEQYQFFFTTTPYLSIFEDSLILLNADVIERTITYYPAPNFAVNGSRYFYHRNRKQNDSVEIELVNPKDRLFREVAQPDRYFYLPSYADLEYVGQIPTMPYYNLTFICNASSSQRQSPLLSYVDRSFSYSPRYLLNIPPLGSDKPVEVNAFADIQNVGEQTIVVKGAELITGDIVLSRESSQYISPIFFNKPDHSLVLNETRPVGEGELGSYVYQLSLPSTITIPGYSLKSIPFLQINVTVDHLLHYSSVFSPLNSTGKLLNVYNLTAVNSFLPQGYANLNEQGRSVGKVYLPDLSPGENYEIISGADADTSYERRVTVLQSDENSDSTTYSVEYFFKNNKPTRDIRFYFFESFCLFKSFQLTNLSIPNNRSKLPNVVLNDTSLRGYVFVPRRGSATRLSYTLIVYKTKPTMRD